MGYMLGLKNGRAYLWGFTIHVKKKFFFFRYCNRLDQIHPIFPGWLTILAAKASSSANKTINRTFEIYSPPIPSKVTDPNTIYDYMLYLQSTTAKVNMKYVNITLDVGAAIVLWTYVETFSNVVTNLEDFHFMKENFKVIFKFGLLC